jgi:hypothetical protein
LPRWLQQYTTYARWLGHKKEKKPGKPFDKAARQIRIPYPKNKK